MTMHFDVRRPRALLGRSIPLIAVACLTFGCSGSDQSDADAPEDVLAAAKSILDDTSGVKLTLATDELPKGTDGVLSATGVGTHAPAFDGSIKVIVNSLTVEVPVVSVNGEVQAKLPFTSEFAPIEPGDYGAPDPADLLSTDAGISSWLTAATDIEEGDKVRDGDAVLTSYTGTLPGDAVAAVIPTADDKADFEVSFNVTDEGELSTIDVSGPFYGDDGDVDYTLTLTDYGTEKDITAP